MRKRIGALTMMLALAAMVADAQDFREKYEQFKQKATQTYNDFRAEANAKYCEFLKGAWEWYEQMPVVKKPKDETVPPVVLPENDKQKPVTVRPILLDTVVAPTPITVVQPTPSKMCRLWLHSFTTSHFMAHEVMCDFHNSPTLNSLC